MHATRRAFAATTAASLALSACGSMVFHNPQAVIVTTNACDASLRGHARLPATIHLERNHDHALAVEAPGYEPETVRFHSHLSWWRILVSVVLNGGHGIFTLGITGVIGCVIDAGSGAWQVLEEEEVHVELARSSPEWPPSNAGPPSTPPPPAARSSARRLPTVRLCFGAGWDQPDASVAAFKCSKAA